MAGQKGAGASDDCAILLIAQLWAQGTMMDFSQCARYNNGSTGKVATNTHLKPTMDGAFIKMSGMVRGVFPGDIAI